MSILKDKQACDSSSHYDARLFVQCMQVRGYTLAVYGPDHKRTSIDALYPSGSGSAGRPQAQQAQQIAPLRNNPPSIAPPAAENKKRAAERSATLDVGSDADKTRDPQGLSQIADIAEFSRANFLKHMGDSNFPDYQKIQADPNAASLDTKLTIANGFYTRGVWLNGKIPNGQKLTDDDAWKTDDRRYSDLQKARVWVQKIFEQVKREHPDVPLNGYGPKAPSDPDSSVARIVIAAKNIWASTPTPEMYQANRDAITKQQRDETLKEQVYRKKLALLLAERKDIGDEVCDGQGHHGYVEKVHGDKIQVSTEGKVKQYGVVINQWQQYQWVDYRTVYKCDEAE